MRPIANLKNLSSLRIYGNPFYCNCTLICPWLKLLQLGRVEIVKSSSTKKYVDCASGPLSNYPIGITLDISELKNYDETHLRCLNKTENCETFQFAPTTIRSVASTSSEEDSFPTVYVAIATAAFFLLLLSVIFAILLLRKLKRRQQSGFAAFFIFKQTFMLATSTARR